MKTLNSSILKSFFILMTLVCFSVVVLSFKNTEKVTKPVKHTVTIVKMKFNPSDLIIHKGDTVEWINKDFFQHDVTEMTSGKWNSKPLNQGETFSKVINEDVKYFCNLHKVMKGTITISK